MLRGIRNASANWLGRIVMGTIMTLLAGSFAVWGINDIFHGRSNTAVAKIGDTEISVDQFRQAYNDRLQQLSQQVGHPITSEQANAFGLDHQVLGQLVVEAGLDQLARRMRLGIPDDELIKRVVNNPVFQTPTGQFDRARFENYLANIGYNEQRFFDEQRRAVPRHEISDAISGGITAPAVLLDAINRFQNEQRSIQYVKLGPAQAGDIAPPTDEELNKYFADRKVLFRAPEYRKVATVAVTPSQLAKTIEVSDADVKKAYDDNINAYVTPERRHVQQIVFPNMADAQAASARLKSGLTFAALATERGLKESDIDLGTVAKSAIIDPAVADAAFSLKEGAVSEPVQGRFGAVIVTVLKIEPKETKSFDTVAPFIRSDIALKRAQTKAQDIHDKMEDARGGGSTVEEAAQTLKLPIVTIDVDRSGRDPSGKPVDSVPDAAAVVSAAFASDVGVDNDPIEFDNGYIWYDVAAITPARDRTLAEVKPEVEQRWHDDEVAKRLKAKAADMLDKLKNGNPFDAIAGADSLKIEAADGLRRGAASPGIPAKLIDAAFHTAKDSFGSTDGDQATQWFVLKVTDVKTPTFDANSADGKKLVDLLHQQMPDDIFSQYVAWMEKDLGTSVDQSLLAQAIGNATENE